MLIDSCSPVCGWYDGGWFKDGQVTVGPVAVGAIDEHLGGVRNPLTRIPEGEECGPKCHRHKVRDDDQHSSADAVRLAAGSSVAIYDFES